VPLHAAPRPPLTLDLPQSGLVHVERPRCVAVLRGRHQRAGNLFGCDRGGGALQSLVAFPDPRVMQGRELVARERFAPVPEGEFALRPAGAPGRLRRLRGVLRADKSDLRFRLFVTRVEWDAHEWLHALVYPLRHGLVRSLKEASPWLASQRDLATGQRVEGDVVEFTGGLADRSGARWPGAATLRRYTFREDRVELRDGLTLSGVRGALRYRLPRALEGVEVLCQGATARRSGREVRVAARGGEVELVISGHYPLVPR